MTGENLKDERGAQKLRVPAKKKGGALKGLQEKGSIKRKLGGAGGHYRLV